MDDPLNDDEERVLTESEVIPLLRRLCVELGFCFSADVAEIFETRPPCTIEAFTRAVFDAAGQNSELAERWLYAQVRNVVATAFNGAARNGV
jgi:hypothetical protein